MMVGRDEELRVTGACLLRAARLAQFADRSKILALLGDPSVLTGASAPPVPLRVDGRAALEVQGVMRAIGELAIAMDLPPVRRHTEGVAAFRALAERGAVEADRVGFPASREGVALELRTCDLRLLARVADAQVAEEWLRGYPDTTGWRTRVFLDRSFRASPTFPAPAGPPPRRVGRPSRARPGFHKVGELLVEARGAIAGSSAENSDFFAGGKPSWRDIVAGLDVRREVVDDVLAEALHEPRAGAPPIAHVLRGTAGSGASTALMRLAAELSALGHDAYFASATDEWLHVQRVLKGATGRVHLFIDDAWLRTGDDLRGAAAQIAAHPEIPVTLYLATRLSAWADVKTAISAHGATLCRHSMDDLRADEIEEFAMRLTDPAGGRWSVPGLTRPGVEKAFREGDGQLLVALAQLRGWTDPARPIEEELARVPPEVVDLIVGVSAFSAHRVPFPRAWALRAWPAVDLDAVRPSVRGCLHITKAELRVRHDLVARWIWEKHGSWVLLERVLSHCQEEDTKVVAKLASRMVAADDRFTDAFLAIAKARFPTQFIRQIAARRLADRDDLEAAGRELDAIAQSFPADAPSKHMRAHLRAEAGAGVAGDFQAPAPGTLRAEFREAIARDPKNVHAYVSLATLEARQGVSGPADLLHSARWVIERGLEEAGPRPELYRAWATFVTREAHAAMAAEDAPRAATLVAEARRAYRALFALESRQSSPWLGYADLESKHSLFLRERNPSRVRAIFHEAWQSAEPDSRILHAWAWFLMKHKIWGDRDAPAVGTARWALWLSREWDDMNVHTWISAAQLEADDGGRLGLPESPPAHSMRWWFDGAFSRAPGLHPAWIARAQAERQVANPAESIRCFERAVEVAADARSRSWTLCSLARVRRESKDIEGALADLRRATEEDPNNAYAWSDIGYTLWKWTDPPDWVGAESAYARGAALDPTGKAHARYAEFRAARPRPS